MGPRKDDLERTYDEFGRQLFVCTLVIQDAGWRSRTKTKACAGGPALLAQRLTPCATERRNLNDHRRNVVTALDSPDQCPQTVGTATSGTTMP